MVRGKKRRYIFKALGTVWPNGKTNKQTRRTLWLKYSMQGEKQHMEIQRQVGISSQSKLFLKYECIPLILQQSNSLKSERLSN